MKAHKKYQLTATRIKPNEKDLAGGDMPLGWCAISNKVEPDLATRRAGSGKWWRIKSGKNVIYRTLRFSGMLKLEQGEETVNCEIVLDYDGWLILYGREKNLDSPLRVEISRAGWWRVVWAIRTHPDPAVRTAAWLGYLSVGLGLIGVVLGVLSLRH